VRPTTPRPEPGRAGTIENRGQMAGYLEPSAISGSLTSNVVPTPSSLVKQTSPPWARAIHCTIDNPRPLPLASLSDRVSGFWSALS